MSGLIEVGDLILISRPGIESPKVGKVLGAAGGIAYKLQFDDCVIYTTTFTHQIRGLNLLESIFVYLTRRAIEVENVIRKVIGW